MPKVPPWIREEYSKLEKVAGRYGVGVCAWDKTPFLKKRPWARFCCSRCRLDHFNAYHPRVHDKAAGRKTHAKALLAVK